MNSSTSSSNHRAVWGVVFGVALLLCLLEVFTRTVLYRMSTDFARFPGYLGQAVALSQSAGLRVALIGNSATEEGVDQAALASLLSQGRQGPTDVTIFTADSSEIITWRAMATDLFWRHGTQPDAIVVTFFGHDLEDSASVELGRVAQFFTRVQDWPDLFSNELTGVPTRVEFMVASVWGTYAARERLKQRVLNVVVPGFRQYEPRLNDLSRRYGPHGGATAARPAASYRALDRLLETAQARGVQMVLVAFPRNGAPTVIDPAIETLAARRGAKVLDMQPLSHIPPEQYSDSIHLTRAGREVYTDLFGRALAPHLVARKQ